MTRYADVPSPRFPGLWQEGRINGDRYFLYANGEATLENGGAEPDWSITVLCDLEARTCTETAEGSPPEAAFLVANLMGQCFVAPDNLKTPAITAPGPALVAPATEGWDVTPKPGEPVAETTDPEPTSAACGLAAVPDEDPGTTLQLLLVEADVDPGPIDGLPGRNTRQALVQVLGESAEDLELEAAVAALNAFLCRTTD
ncbi:hypothetical protein [Roseivivax sp. CAU 1753]